MKTKRNNIYFGLRKIISGVVIGIGGIVPGVSGSIMAVSLGVYKGMIDSISHFFRHPKKSILYLLPIGIGALIGLFSMSNAVEWLMLNWRTPILFLFMGLVAGGIPTIIREGNKPHGFKKSYLIATAAGFACILLLAYFSNENTAQTTGTATLLPHTAIISGAILAFGTMIPGLSVSFILIHMGVYEPLMAALNQLDIGLLAFVGLGFILVALLIVKAVGKLFDRHAGFAYYTVLGFSIASILIIIPPVALDISLLGNILLCLGGFLVAYFMSGKDAANSSDA